MTEFHLPTRYDKPRERVGQGYDPLLPEPHHMKSAGSRVYQQCNWVQEYPQSFRHQLLSYEHLMTEPKDVKLISKI